MLRLASEDLDDGIDRISLVLLDLELELHQRQIAFTSVEGETSRKICSALIRASSEANAESRKTARSGARFAMARTTSRSISVVEAGDQRVIVDRRRPRALDTVSTLIGEVSSSPQSRSTWKSRSSPVRPGFTLSTSSKKSD